MLLAVDIGNSNIVIGIFKGERLQGIGRKNRRRFIENHMDRRAAATLAPVTQTGQIFTDEKRRMGAFNRRSDAQ